MPDHAAHRTALQVTQLEDRLTPAVTIPRAPRVLMDSTGQLSILGTPRADYVHVQRDGRDVVVRVLGRRPGEFRFDAALVRHIAFVGGAGNDVFVNQTSVASVADGGAGRDTLQGGSAADALFGGAGDDRLQGQGGDDYLHGGAGRNTRNLLLGEDGVDTLVSLSRHDLLDPGPQTAPTPVATVAPLAVDRIAQDIVRLTNDFRSDNRLRLVTVDARLTQAAQAHAQEMARTGQLSHELNGKGPGDRAAAALYPTRYVGENIARMLNQADPATTTVQGWQNSPSHRTNLLNGRYRSIGVGVALGSDGWVYLVQLFGG